MTIQDLRFLLVTWMENGYLMRPSDESRGWEIPPNCEPDGGMVEWRRCTDEDDDDDDVIAT